jgi:hypothetical protein
VGFNHFNGQFTHHIGPDVDGERDLLFRDLDKCGGAVGCRRIAATDAREGRNGGGDRYTTDGRLGVVVLPLSAVRRMRSSISVGTSMPGPPAEGQEVF